GALSKAKAAELARVSDATNEEQAALVETAKASSVEQLARAVDRWQIEHEAEAARVEQSMLITPAPGGGRVEAQHDTGGLKWVQVPGGAAAEQLGRREVPGARRWPKGLGGGGRCWVEHADIPSARVGRPRVVVTMDIEPLAAAAGGTARLDSGAYVGGEVARQLACDAGVVRMITD